MEPCIFEAGPDAIRDAVDEQVSWMFGDADEIGSSDVSACVRSVFSCLGYSAANASDHDYHIIRDAVYKSISRLNQASWERAPV